MSKSTCIINAFAIRGLLDSNGVNMGTLSAPMFDCSGFGGKKKEVRPNGWGFYRLRRCGRWFEWQAMELGGFCDFASMKWRTTVIWGCGVKSKGLSNNLKQEMLLWNLQCNSENFRHHQVEHVNDKLLCRGRTLLLLHLRDTGLVTLQKQQGLRFQVHLCTVVAFNNRSAVSRMWWKQGETAASCP